MISQLNRYEGKACGGVQLQSAVFSWFIRCRHNHKEDEEHLGPLQFPKWAHRSFPQGPAAVVDPRSFGLSRAQVQACYDELTDRIMGHIRRQIQCANIAAGKKIIKVSRLSSHASRALVNYRIEWLTMSNRGYYWWGD